MTDKIISLRSLGRTTWGITEKSGRSTWRRLTFKAGKDTSGRKQARDLRRIALLDRNRKEIQNLQMEYASKAKAAEEDQQPVKTHPEKPRTTGMSAPSGCRPIALLMATAAIGMSSMLRFPTKGM